MQDHEVSNIFENARPNLLGLAYRILGSLADAEDVVQDTYIKWATTDRDKIDNAGSWLTTVCTRRCFDVLKSADRKRVSYVGTWLPEPIHTPIENDSAASLDLASSLTTAFLLMLERLTPKERAAYLLYEIFDVPYPEIAQTLGVHESACRKLVSRAKSNIDKAKVRHTTPLDKQDQFLDAFRTAITQGDTTPLTTLLSDDVRLSADGGGKVPAILETLHGRNAVLTFLTERLHDYWGNHVWQVADINGCRGAVLKDGESIEATVSFAYDEAGEVKHIYIVRNPDKLANLDTVAIH